MADMVFKYSAMNGGKTLNILQTVHSYEENNFNVFNDVDAYIYVSNICNLPLLQMAY